MMERGTPLCNLLLWSLRIPGSNANLLSFQGARLASQLTRLSLTDEATLTSQSWQGDDTIALPFVLDLLPLLAASLRSLEVNCERSVICGRAVILNILETMASQPVWYTPPHML